VKNSFTDAANKVMDTNKVSKKAQVRWSVFTMIVPRSPSYRQVNKNAPVPGRVSS
jgi:hypothetical protein